MAQRESILPILSSSIYIKIRQDFLIICKNDHCMAALLSYYEYKLNAIISNIEEEQLRNKNYKPTAETYFIECSPSFLSKSLLGLFGRTKIIEANKRLHELNFITAKTEKTGKAYKTTKVSLNIEPIKIRLLWLFENEQPLIQKRTTPCSEMDNPLFEFEQGGYSETNRIINTSLNKVNKINKKEKFFLDFESDLIEIFNNRPNIEAKVLEWIDYKFDLKKTPYVSLLWLTKVLKYSDKQINESIELSLIREYAGFFPDSIKDNTENKEKEKVEMYEVRLNDTVLWYRRKEYEILLETNQLNCDNPIILNKKWK